MASSTRAQIKARRRQWRSPKRKRIEVKKRRGQQLARRKTHISEAMCTNCSTWISRVLPDCTTYYPDHNVLNLADRTCSLKRRLVRGIAIFGICLLGKSKARSGQVRMVAATSQQEHSIVIPTTRSYYRVSILQHERRKWHAGK